MEEVETGTTYLAKILEAFPCEWMRWLAPSTRECGNYLGENLGGCSVLVDELVGSKYQRA